MTVEAATYITDLNITLPTGNDFVSEGDDHFRMLKAVLKNSFPNINAPVTVTPDQINDVVNKVNRAGDTMTGVLTVPGLNSNAPDANTHPYMNLRLEDGTLKSQFFYNRTDGKTVIRHWYSLSAYSSLALTSNAVTFNSNTLWHSGNDGAGSGLDADTLDGVQGSGYALVDLSTTSDSVVLAKIKNVDGAGSGLDADTLDGAQPDTASTANTIAQRDANAVLRSAALAADGASGYLIDVIAPDASPWAFRFANTTFGPAGFRGYQLNTGEFDLVLYDATSTIVGKWRFGQDGVLRATVGGIDANTLSGASVDVSPTPDTIAKRTSTGRLDSVSLMVEPDGTGHGKAYVRNANGAVAEIIKRNDGGMTEIRCWDAAGNLKSSWAASENGNLSAWSLDGNKLAYIAASDRWEFYHGAGDYSSGSFARYISWKVAENETNKACYVDQVNGDDTTGEPNVQSKPFKSLTAAAHKVPRGGKVRIHLLSDYTLTYDEDFSGRTIELYVDGHRLSTQWYTATVNSTNYAAAYRINIQGCNLLIFLDTRNGVNSQLYIPRRDATLASYPLQPLRSGLFYVGQYEGGASVSFIMRADSTSAVPPIYVGDGYFIHTNTWAYDHYSRLSVSIGAHYGSAAAGNAIVLDKTNIDTKLVQSSYACDYSFYGALAEGARLFVDEAGNKIAHADAIALSAGGTHNRAARSINYYFSDGSHPGNTWGECGNVVIYDTAGTYTYTPTSGIRGIIVTLVGGGGGGAYGYYDATANYGYGGESGENGGLLRLWMSRDLLFSRGDSSFDITVGAGGAPGSASSAAGIKGSNSEFVGSNSGVYFAIADAGGGGRAGYNGNQTPGTPGSVLDGVVTLATCGRRSFPGNILFIGSGSTNEILQVPGGQASMITAPEETPVAGGVLYGESGMGGAGGDVQYASGWANLSATSGSHGIVMIEEYF